MATVLVAFAVTEFNPSQISTGNETSVPPPATELMAPARKAAPKATAACVRSKYAILTRAGRSRDLRLNCRRRGHEYSRDRITEPGRTAPPQRNLPAPDRGSHENRRSLSGNRKSTRLNSSHLGISYAVFCLK